MGSWVLYIVEDMKVGRNSWQLIARFLIIHTWEVKSKSLWIVDKDNGKNSHQIYSNRVTCIYRCSLRKWLSLVYHPNICMFPLKSQQDFRKLYMLLGTTLPIKKRMKESSSTNTFQTTRETNVLINYKNQERHPILTIPIEVNLLIMNYTGYRKRS